MERLRLYQDCLKFCLGGFGLFGSLSLFFYVRLGIRRDLILQFKGTKGSRAEKMGKTEILSDFIVELEILIAHGKEQI